MKNSLYGDNHRSTINRPVNIFLIIKVLAFGWVLALIYACSTVNSEDYSAMSNHNQLLEKGDEAPKFTADTYNGIRISLTQLQKSGPVVLVLIRGFS